MGISKAGLSKMELPELEKLATTHRDTKTKEAAEMEFADRLLRAVGFIKIDGPLMNSNLSKSVRERIGIEYAQRNIELEAQTLYTTAFYGGLTPPNEAEYISSCVKDLLKKSKNERLLIKVREAMGIAAVNLITKMNGCDMLVKISKYKRFPKKVRETARTEIEKYKIMKQNEADATQLKKKSGKDSEAFRKQPRQRRAGIRAKAG